MPEFFDDTELRSLGISLPTVNALRRAVTVTSSTTAITLLDLDETQQIALEASGNAASALELVQAIINDLQNRPEPIDNSAELRMVAQRLQQVLLQLAAIEDYSGRIAKIERRINDLELIAHGNNVY